MLNIPQNIYLRYGLVATGVTGISATMFYYLRPYIPRRFGGLIENNTSKD